jgi:nicotinamidase-related amidase
MLVPEVITAVQELERNLHDKEKLDCIVIGIETHICVLQTSLDLLARGHRVYVVQDAVSSCNAEERGVALARLRQEGVRVTSSESLIYEIMGDAGDAA